MDVVPHRCRKGCTRESTCNCDYFNIGQRVRVAFPTREQEYPSELEWNTLFYLGVLIEDNSGLTSSPGTWAIAMDDTPDFLRVSNYLSLRRVYRHSRHLRRIIDSNDIEFYDPTR